MFHTDYDFATFIAGILGLLGTLAAAVYAVTIGVALFRKAFRSLSAVSVSFLLSALVSVPFVIGCGLNLRYGELLGSEMSVLPDPLDDWPVLEWLRADVVMLLAQGLLLGFVWVVPLLQYRRLRQRGPITRDKSR